MLTLPKQNKHFLFMGACAQKGHFKSNFEIHGRLGKEKCHLHYLSKTVEYLKKSTTLNVMMIYK